MDVAIGNSRLQNVWGEYNQVRLTGQKKAANQLLAVFIEQLKQEEYNVIECFVDALCTAVLDADTNILANNGILASSQAERIQHPLFREIILPVLTKQYLQNSSKHIKWIGQFEQFFYTDTATARLFMQQIHEEGFYDPAYFFEKAFTIGQEQDALTLLLDQLARTINYYFHEVPDSMLATPPVLQAALERFKSFWTHSQQQSNWVAVLAYWERLSSHWTRYNSDSTSYSGFAHYLSLHNILLD